MQFHFHHDDLYFASQNGKVLKISGATPVYNFVVQVANIVDAVLASDSSENTEDRSAISVGFKNSELIQIQVHSSSEIDGHFDDASAKFMDVSIDDDDSFNIEVQVPFDDAGSMMLADCVPHNHVAFSERGLTDPMSDPISKADQRLINYIMVKFNFQILHIQMILFTELYNRSLPQ